MDFRHSLEQDMLRESAAAAFGRGTAGGDAEALAELGVWGLLVAEANGGLGLGLVEAALVLGEAGRAGRSGTLAETLLVADGLAAHSEELRERALSGGATAVAPFSGSLRRQGERLTGALKLARPHPDGWIAAPVDAGDAVALLRAGRFEPRARARLEAEADACEIAVDAAADEAIVLRIEAFGARLSVLRAAELLGIADRSLTLSLDYIRTRTQFGQPVGANQALKHIAADTYLALENLRVAVEYAAAAIDQSDRGGAGLTPEAGEAVRVVLAYAPTAAREIAETAIHLHGGIGLTWDYPLNAALRRIVRLGTALGGVSERRIGLLETFRRDRAQGADAPASPQHRHNGAHHDGAL